MINGNVTQRKQAESALQTIGSLPESSTAFLHNVVCIPDNVPCPICSSMHFQAVNVRGNTKGDSVVVDAQILSTLRLYTVCATML
jgi:hypothetical protein